MSEAEKIAAELPPSVKRAVLLAPFNSKGCGIRGSLAKWNEGNSHMRSDAPALFVRTMKQDCSGDYVLTEFGLRVRAVLQAHEPAEGGR